MQRSTLASVFLILLAVAVPAVEPSITIDVPNDGAVLRDLDAVQGMVRGAPGMRLAVGLHRLAPGAAWWHWRDRVWHPTPVLGSVANPTVWSVGLPFLDTGDYEFTTHLVENAAVRTQIRFSIDRLPPRFTVATPAEGVEYGASSALSASGDFIDAGRAGVDAATLVLIRMAGPGRPVQDFWNWTTARWEVTGSAASAVRVSLLFGAWYQPLPRLDAGAYRLVSNASDRVNNRVIASREFTVRDNMAPTVLVDRPLDLASYATLNEARGTASDVGGGAVARVELRLARDRDGTRTYRRWSDGTWQPASDPGTFAFAIGTTSWRRAMPPLSDGWYDLEVSAIDTWSNRGPIFPLAVSFRIDRTAPSMAFSAPAAWSELPDSSPAEFAGWTQDASPSTTTLRLVRFDAWPPRWWNWQRQGWTPLPWMPGVALDLGAQGSWSAATPPLAAGAYGGIAVAVDAAGNTGLAATPFVVVPSAAQ